MEAEGKSMTEAYHMITCPHPDCDGTLKIRPDLPAGEYLCLCHYCQVALTWATYLEGGRKPHVALVEKGEAKT